MNCQSQRVAMTQRENLRLVARSAGERIARRCRAIVAKPENFAAMTHRILSALIEGASHSHEQISIRRKDDPRRGCAPIVDGVGNKNIANVEEPMAIEPAPCKRRR